ncbi:MAG: Hint domain-containing protein, partial [Janthinobacterium lividum]
MRHHYQDGDQANDRRRRNLFLVEAVVALNSLMETPMSGTVTLTGTTGSPVSAETAANTTVTYQFAGTADTFNITGDAGSTSLIDLPANTVETLNLVANGASAFIILQNLQTQDTLNVTVENGGDFQALGYFSKTQSSGSLTFGTGGGEVELGNTGTYTVIKPTQVVYGFTNNSDILADHGLKFSAITQYTIANSTTTGQQTITVAGSTGNFVFTTSGTSFAAGTYTSLTSGPLQLTNDGGGGTNVTVTACFLTGVMIATPDGETAVEALSVGDLVSVVEHGETVSRPVTWIGNRTVSLAADAAIDAYPVRIRAGAFAENVPHRDLLVTSEHCIHVNDVLVPVRMLVNDASIQVDTSITQFTYYHVELERHAILVAEGLQTESYLDTGNRGNFQNNPVPSVRVDLSVDPTYKSWADAAAPLAVDRGTVEPIWNRLAARSARLGMTGVPSRIGIGNEPAFRLVTDAGLEVSPTLCDGTFYAFVVPASTRALRLVSNASRPSGTIGPFVDDRRELGVLVGRIGFYDGPRRILLDAHLADAVLPGWHGKEENVACRWTNGDALLPVYLSGTKDQEVFLDIEVLAAG